MSLRCVGEGEIEIGNLGWERIGKDITDVDSGGEYWLSFE